MTEPGRGSTCPSKGEPPNGPQTPCKQPAFGVKKGVSHKLKNLRKETGNGFDMRKG